MFEKFVRPILMRIRLTAEAIHVMLTAGKKWRDEMKEQEKKDGK